MTGAVLVQSKLPLPLLRRGKVREVYEVDDATLLLVASDRVSAFDVVMQEAVPHKGAVLTLKLKRGDSTAFVTVSGLTDKG